MAARGWRLLLGLSVGAAIPRFLRRTLLTTAGPFLAQSEVEALDFPPLPEVADCHGRQVRVLQMVGAGAQGAVFKAQVKGEDQLAVLKVSRGSSAASVSRECAILRQLRQIPSVVRCLEECLISGRQSILLSPFFADAVQMTSSSKLPEGLELRRLSSFLGSAFALLQAEVAQADLQVLQKKDGELLWIDFTEAKVRSEDPEQFEVAARNFVSEVFTLIPLTSRDVAISVLASLCSKGPGVYSYLWAELPWNEDGEVAELQPCYI